jgi:hypothetical protein
VLDPVDDGRQRVGGRGPGGAGAVLGAWGEEQAGEGGGLLRATGRLLAAEPADAPPARPPPRGSR